MEKIIGFHATDKALADSIIANGFSFSRSEEHWLGNGVYFFTDPDLAVWWCNNPTNKFGVKIENPCILFSEIESENLLDMRRLKDYNYVAGLYYRFINSSDRKIFEAAFPKNKYIANLRCTFFDWLHVNANIDVLVAPFSNPRASFLENGPLPDEFNIPFVHSQICVFKNDCIKSTIIFQEVSPHDRIKTRHRFR